MLSRYLSEMVKNAVVVSRHDCLQLVNSVDPSKK